VCTLRFHRRLLANKCRTIFNRGGRCEVGETLGKSKKPCSQIRGYFYLILYFSSKKLTFLFINFPMKNKDTLPLVFMLEQDADDKDITETILKETGHRIDIRFFNDQQSFFKELSEAKELPAVVILSYNSIPGNMTEVLHLLKSNFRFTRIPVIVLSESATSSVVQDAYFFGASSVITKPFTDNDAVNKISGFFNYWFKIVTLPVSPRS
jgi:CheY-like chemotaxis protein